MLRISRLVGLATVIAAFSLVAASAASAQAISVCQINGAAGGLNPGVQNFKDDVTNNNATQPNMSGPGYDHIALPSTPLDVVLDRDSGSYNFDTLGAPAGAPSVCAQVGVGTVGAGTVRIQSNGSYIDTICGTGEAYSGQQGDGGTTTITPLTTVGTFTVPTGINYRILFAGGSGALVGGFAGSPGVAAGYINIAPTVGNCATTDVTQFNVTGGFVAVG
jgi:hypothetical protein